MKIKVVKAETYIPKWNGNKKDSSPIEVDIEHPTPEQIDECANIQTGKIDKKLMFKYAVKTIRNLEVEDGGPITTAEELLKQPGLTFLYFEIVNYVASFNPVVNSKNS